jgi:hypothetical protein
MIGLMVGSTNLPVGANFDSQMWPEHGAECVTAATTKKGFARSGRRPANAHGADRGADRDRQGRPAAFVSVLLPCLGGPCPRLATPTRAPASPPWKFDAVAQRAERFHEQTSRWPPIVADHVHTLLTLGTSPMRARGVRGTSSTSSASLRSRARTSSANIARWRPWPKRSSSTTHRSASRAPRLQAVNATLWHLEG